MKFGHTLKQEEANCLCAHIEFTDFYLDYKGLKKILRKCREGIESDEVFVEQLRKEIRKVDLFFTSKEEEFAATFKLRICPRVLKVCANDSAGVSHLSRRATLDCRHEVCNSHLSNIQQ